MTTAHVEHFCCNHAHHPSRLRGWTPMFAGEHVADGRTPCIRGPHFYRTVVIDPPWEFRQKWRQRGKGNAYDDNHDGLRSVFRRGPEPAGIRGAAAQYRCMDMHAIADLPVTYWAAQASHLYLWTPNAFIEEACELVRRWGFQFILPVTWIKPQLGMGMYYRNTTEHALFGVRGGLKTLARNMPTHIIAPRGKHSENPDEFYEVVDRMSPGPRLDVFARKEREGWDVWGDQVPQGGAA